MLNTRQRVGSAPALFENTRHNSNELKQPTAKDIVLSLDPTARFYHYGPQGFASGWVRGDRDANGREWETPITWNEAQAWKDALTQLQAQRPDAQEAVELTPGGMYPKETDAEGHTLHSRHCKAAFARRDWQCHRCCELMHGAAPRDGWQRPFFARKLREVQKRMLFPHSA